MIKKVFAFVVLFLVTFIFCVPVKAEVCTEKEIENLEKLAEKIRISQEFQKSPEANHTFNITVYNISNKVYLRLPNGMDFLSEKSQAELGSFLDGTSFKIYVYASEKTNCSDEALRTLTVELPMYNDYSERDECKGNKNLDICKEWADTQDITEEEFLKKVKEQVRVLEPITQSTLLEIFNKYGLYILGFVIVAGIGITAYVVRKNKNKVKIDI